MSSEKIDKRFPIAAREAAKFREDAPMAADSPRRALKKRENWAIFQWNLFSVVG